jgi:glycosyltransferase involved in cell wall biosynthesis
MKLLFVHQNFGEFGGAEVNIQLVARELSQRGHSCALAFRHHTGRGEQAWHEVFSRDYCLSEATQPGEVRQVMVDFAPDLIYLHTLSGSSVLQELIETAVPVVKMVHDHTPYCLRSYKYNPLSRHPCQRALSPYCIFPCLAPLARNRQGPWPFKWASYSEKRRELNWLRKCRHLVVYSDYQRQELVRNGFDPEKILVCVPIAVPDQGAWNKQAKDRNLLLYAGQIIRGKGVDALLRALAQVQVPFECVVVGDGHHRAECERLSRQLKLQGRVHFVGYRLPHEVEQYYLEASVFVMSSLWPEPFGMVGPEAMRHGLPVVAFDAGAIREWLHDGENGFLVPWNDTQQFARGVERLLKDKCLAREMGRRGSEGVGQYATRRQVDRLERLFQEVVAGARGRAAALAVEQAMTYD